MDKISIETFKVSQAGGFKHKQLGMKQRINLQKSKLDFLPYKRTRLLENTPFEYRLVQKQRLKTRDLSTTAWLKHKEVAFFEEMLAKDLIKLKILTKFYHIIQKIKNKIGMKTI